MRSYGQYCPIALAAEVFAERWTPIVLRNLMVGCERFGEVLDGAPGMSRSVLVHRLRDLQRAGVVEVTGSGQGRRYRLTAAGRELCDVVLALGAWGARWREAAPQQQDPYLMLWGLSRLIDPATLPRPRVVVRFQVTDHRTPDRFWLVARTGGNEVCVTEPGFVEDGVVVTGTAALYRWHSGRLALGHAERSGAMQVSGPRWLHRTLAAWGRLSPFADVSKPDQPGRCSGPNASGRTSLIGSGPRGESTRQSGPPNS